MPRYKYRNILPFKFLSGALNRDLKLLFDATFIGAFGTVSTFTYYRFTSDAYISLVGWVKVLL